MRTQRLKIIPDRIFHKIWLLSLEYDKAEDFTSSVIHGPKVFNGERYGLDYIDTIEFLKTVYDLSHMSFSDIVTATGCKKSEISHIFCIPIRTVEDWYSGKNKAPSYVDLMIMKQFHIFSLGKYIRLESDIIHAKTQPPVYTKRAPKEIKVPEETTYENDLPYEYVNRAPMQLDDDFESNEEYEKYLDRLVEQSVKNRRSKTSKDAIENNREGEGT